MKQLNKSFVGRLIVIGVFTLVTGYFSIAVFGSILAHLYGAPPKNETTSDNQEHNWCVRNLVGLRDELDNAVTQEIVGTKRRLEPSSHWQAWNALWLSKFEQAQKRCTQTGNAAMDQGFNHLISMHHGYLTTVETFVATRSQSAQGLSEAIRTLKNRNPN